MSVVLLPSSPLSTFAVERGDKAYNLARIERLGITVPPWFCLPAQAFKHYLYYHNLEARLQGDVEELFCRLPLPPSLTKEIHDTCNQLHLDGQLLTILSNDPQQDDDLILYKANDESLSSGIRQRWADSYRFGNLEVAIILQQIVEAESVGTAFSRDPKEPLAGESVRVDANWGLRLTDLEESDTFTIVRSSSRVSSQVREKPFALALSDEGLPTSIELDKEQRCAPSLTQDHARQVAKLAMVLEEHLEVPQRCNWAFAEETLFCVDSIPIPSLPPTKYYSAKVNGERTTLWDNSRIHKHLHRVISPLTFSFLNKAYQQIIKNAFQLFLIPRAEIKRQEPTLRGVLGYIRGYAYHNLINKEQLLSLARNALGDGKIANAMIESQPLLSKNLSGILSRVESPAPSTGLRKVRVITSLLKQLLCLDSRTKQSVSVLHTLQRRKRDLQQLSLPRQADLFHEMHHQLMAHNRSIVLNELFYKAADALLKKIKERTPWKVFLHHRLLSFSTKVRQRRRILHREIGRVLVTFRRLFHAMGENLSALGFLDDPDDIFCLTIDELIAFIEGRPTTMQLRELTKLRKKELAIYQDHEAPPAQFLTKGTPSASIPFPQLLADGNLAL